METYARDEGSERYQEACDWFVRLREAAEDADVVAQWLAWCSSEPLNREAFERVRADWVALGMVAPGAFENPPHAARQASLGTTPDRGRKRITRQPLLRKAAGIAALATCLGAAWLIWNDSQMSAAEVSILSTSPTERRSVHLDDGSLVELSGDSRLEVRMYPRRRDILLLRGEAYFSVAHDPGRPFIVRASSLNVRAVGTRFDVRTADSRVVVAVEEGVVEVGPPGDTRSTVGAIISRLHMLDGGSGSMPRLQLTSIRSGQEVAAVPDQELQILPIEPTAVASWRQGRLRFAREPLKSVIASIRAVSGKQIELADPELAELRFTGTVFSSGVDAWVMALPAVFPVSVHPDGAKFIITHRVESQN